MQNETQNGTIRFDGYAENLFNFATCCHAVSETEQVLVLGFGYESKSPLHISIPLPPDVHEWSVSSVPATFFTGLERSFPADSSIGAIMYRHRLDDMEPVQVEAEPHKVNGQTVLSFRLPAGNRRFGPLAIRTLLPYDKCLWLPQTEDCGQRVYVVPLPGTKPSGSWAKTAYQLAIATKSEELGNIVNTSEFGWRNAGRSKPKAITEMVDFRSRQ